jgi:hypothetical protein
MWENPTVLPVVVSHVPGAPVGQSASALQPKTHW